MLMIKPGAFFGGSSLARSLVVLKGKLKRCIHPISRSKFLKLPSAWSRQPEDDAEIPSGRSLATIFHRSVSEAGWWFSPLFCSCIMIWSRHPIETLQPFFWVDSWMFRLSTRYTDSMDSSHHDAAALRFSNDFRRTLGVWSLAININYRWQFESKMDHKNSWTCALFIKKKILLPTRIQVMNMSK